MKEAKLWVKLVVAISGMLVVAWSLMIYLAYTERRDASTAQAQEFAESVNQMTMATLTAMMITGVSKDRAVFLDQIRNAQNISDLNVYRGDRIIAAFGAGAASEAAPAD